MLIAEGKVLTENDFIKLSSLPKDNTVGVATGWGEYGFFNCSISARKKSNGNVLFFETKRGYRIMMHSQQNMFCKISRQKRYYYFSIGELDGGYLLFVLDFFQPQAVLSNILSTFNKIWFIDSYDDINEAITDGNICSIKYGLPFVNFIKRRNFFLDFELVKKIFESVNTSQRAENMFENEKVNIKYPHLFGKNITSGKILNLTLFGDNIKSPDNSRYRHKIFLENPNDFIVKRKRRYDNLNFTELVATISDYKELQTFAETLLSLDDARIVSRYKIIEGECFFSLPACNVHMGMDIPVFDGKKIVEDIIIKRKNMEYTGELYKLDLKDFYNIIYNGVVVNLI